MYNRYVPQNDGSYCRRVIPDIPKSPPVQTCPPEPASVPPQKCPEQTGLGIGSFFRQLLPGGFDTEDLLVVILLLLMAGDCRENKNTALLTLALYLFL